MNAIPSRGVRTGRAVKVLVYLEAQKHPQAVGEIIKAVEPSCNCALMYGTLSTLQRRGKLAVHKVDGRNTFSILPGALLHRRHGTRLDNPPIPVKTARKARAEARRLLKSKPPVKNAVTKPASPASVPTSRTKAAHSAFLITPNSIHHQVTSAHGGAYLAAKRLASAQISADIAAFEAAGGRVEKLSVGASSRPLSLSYRDQAAVLTQLANGDKSRKNGSFKPAPPPIDDLDDDTED